MSDGVLIASIGLAQTALAGFFVWQQKRQADHIQEIKTATDGMKDALVNATAKASRAEGVVAGIEQQKQESK